MEKEIFLIIHKLVNQGHKVVFAEDWGGNSLTLCVDEQHIHCGDPDSDYEVMIQSVKAALQYFQ